MTSVTHVIRTRGKDTMGCGHYQLTIRTRVLDGLVMDTLGGNTMDTMGKLTTIFNGTKDGDGNILLYGTSVGGLATHLVTTHLVGTRKDKCYKNSYGRLFVLYRFVGRGFDHSVTMVLPTRVGHKLSNFGIRQDTVVPVFLIFGNKDVTFTLFHCGIRGGKVVGVLGEFGGLGGTLGVISIYLGFMVGPRKTRGVTFTFTTTFTGRTRVFVGTTIVFHSKRVVIIRGGGRVTTLLTHGVGTLGHFTTTREAITSGNGSIFLTTTGVPTLYGATHGTCKNKNITSVGRVVLTLGQVYVSHCVVVFYEVRVDILSTNRRFVQVTLIQGVGRSFVLK